MSGAPNHDALPTDPAVLGDRFALGAYESTQVDRVFTPSRMWGIGWLVAAGVATPIALIPPLAGGAVVVALVLLAVLAVPPAMIGAVLLARARLLRVDRLHWFTDGVVQLVGDDPEPHALRWPDATWLSAVLMRPDESTPHLFHVTVGDRHGNVVAAERVSSGSLRVTIADALARKADQMLSPLVVPPMIDAIDAGGSVVFGDLGIDRATITDARSAPIPWPEIRSITIDARLKITVHPHRHRSHTFDLERVPNGFFAWQVVQHAADLAGVRVRYTQEGRLPKRVRT